MRFLFSRSLAVPVIVVCIGGLLAPGTLTAQGVPVRLSGTTAVGQQAAVQTVSVTLQANGTAAAPATVTQGVDAGEFQITNGGSCAAGQAYTQGQTCTVQVVFAPHFPGKRSGAVLLKDTAGHLLGSTLLLGSATGSLPRLSPGRIDTVAGDGSLVFAGDGPSALGTSLFLPNGLAVDVAGNLFISDSLHNRIRRVDVASGRIATVVGTGDSAYNGDGAQGTATAINQPAGLALDGAGNLYFADTGNGLIRRLDIGTGQVSTVAGSPASQGYAGDGGLATAASMTLPEGIVFDDSGNLLIADSGNNAIRLLDATTGHIRTLAGTGVAGFSGDGGPAVQGRLSRPRSLVVAPDGSILFADFGNDRVRKISTGGMLSTIVGTGVRGFTGDNGSPTQAALNAPTALALDPAGDLYIADSGNNRIRMINVADGTIGTLAGGSDKPAPFGDGGPADQANLYGPYALLFAADANLLVADMLHNRVRRIGGQATTLNFATIRVSKTSPPQMQGLANSGNDALTLSTPGLLHAALDPTTSLCLHGAISPGVTCNLGVEFAPTVIGTLVQGNVTVNSNSGATTPVITVQGEVLSVEPTATTLTVSANPALVGSALTLTATVTSDDTSRSGPVKFLEGQNTLCTATLNANGVATCSTSVLSLGSHDLLASYEGDANNASSVSAVVRELIQQAPQLVLEATPNPSVVTGTVSLRLTASATTGTPTGAVSFFDGSTLLGTAVLSNAGVATLNTSQLAPGMHVLSVQYAGDATNAAGTSNNVNESVQQASTATTLAASNSTLTVGEALTLSAQVSSPSGPLPTGQLTFRDGATVLGSATLDASGKASLHISTLAPGTHSFTAAYEGDTNSLASSSAPLSGTIAQVGTSVAVSTSANPLSAGAVLRLNATVSPTTAAPDAGALTGSVTFSDGNTVLGTDILDAAGHATLAVPGLSVGTHPITAAYSGNTNYAPNNSAALNEVVNTTATTTSLSSSTSTAFAGKLVTLSVSVTSPTGVPTGAITLRDGAVSIGQVTLSTSGTATFSSSSLSTGTHTLFAVFSGDASYSASTSSNATVAVSLAQPVLTLSGPATPVTAGLAASFTVAATSEGVQPTGTLSLRDGSISIATQALGNGMVSFSSDALAVGTHSLSVVYGGDAANAAATSNPLTVQVQQAATTTSLSGTSPVTVGTTLTLLSNVASSSPHLGGSVTFQEGSTVLGVAALGADGIARFATSALAPGDHALLAIYGGDSNHAGSSSALLTVRMVEPSAGTLSSDANPAVSGLPVVFAAKFSASTAPASGVTGTVPTGTVLFTDNGTSLGSATLDASGAAFLRTATLAVGVHTIQAVFGGDAHFASASASLTQSISSASTQMSLTAPQSLVTYAAPLTLTATILSNGGVATGSIIFNDGTNAIGTGLLNAQGVAQLTVTTLSPGAHVLTAVYAGDGRASASASGPLNLSVKQSTAALLSSSANPALTLSAVQFTVLIQNAGAAVATGTVTLLDGANVLGTTALDGSGRASLSVPQMSAGTHAITARYDGDDKNFATQTTTALTETVQRRTSSTALTFSSTNTANPQQVTLIALVRGEGSVPPGGTVTFTSGTTLVGTSPVDATGVATLTIELETKQESVRASYGGDAAYLTSNSADATVTAGAATQFTLQVNPAEVTVATKQHVAVTVTLQSVKGFNDTLKLGCLGLPFAATCTFSAPETKLTADGTATVQLMLDTGNPLGSGAQTAEAKGERQGGAVLLCVLPAALLLCCNRRLRTKLGSVRLLTLLLAGALAIGASGCSGLQISGTPAGSYTLKVTASGAGTGATQSQTVVLKVTE